MLGAITPEATVAALPAELRGIGVTRQKTEYLLALARSILSGTLDLDGLGGQTFDEARRALLSVRGIGPWTADAYLLSALRFPDVFPVGDRALQVGTAEVLGLSAVPGPDELELLALPWRPIRAAAARIIWHSYLRRRGRVEPPDPTADHLGHTPPAPA
jgi:DNA-3-methyladenine glycosylase II